MDVRPKSKVCPAREPIVSYSVSYYFTETFSGPESEILRRYFTNLDQPVFALVNLPEVVKGALFARYSRSPKSLRRLFLDEFVGDLDMTGDLTVDATIGLERAEALYDKVFFEYGDDSVAQLGGVHLACEQSSNILTKVLEWGRLAAYLEQSTRYIPYDSRLENGRYRYYRDKQILESSLGAMYVSSMDLMFDTYAQLLPKMQAHFSRKFPKSGDVSDFVWRRSIQAKALDALRGLLPAASLSNVGIYGTGQSFEQLLLRMRANPLPEVREYSEMILIELRKVIPSFLRRVDMQDRGIAWTKYLSNTAQNTESLAEMLIESSQQVTGPSVDLVDFDPDGEQKVIAAMLYSASSAPENEIERICSNLSESQKTKVFRSYVGERANRRHKPGRAFERTSYRFDVVSDYGAFRDMQRHRMLTLEWQVFSDKLGYSVPDDVTEADLEAPYREVMACSSDLYSQLKNKFPNQAPYALSLAFNIRYSMQMNAREAMHLIELRSSAQGHANYRTIAQQMHDLIRHKANHRLIAESMSFVDFANYDLERLESETRSERRRDQAAD